MPKSTRSEFSVALIMLFAVSPAISACTKATAPDPESALVQGWAVSSQTSSSEVLMVAGSEDGLALGFLSPSVSGTTGYNGVGMLTASTANGDAAVWIDASGRPTQAVVNGVTFLFANWTSTTVDVAIITPGGSSTIKRGVSVPSSLANPSSVLASRLSANGAIAASISVTPSQLLSWGGLVLSGISCVVSAVSPLAPAAILLCGSFALDVLSTLSSSDNQQLSGSAVAFGALGDLVGCVTGNAYACVGTIVSFSETIGTLAVGVVVNEPSAVQSAKGALASGSGDVQVTLTWDAAVDLDIWVTDPRGVKIYYNNPTSPSGGFLDRDNVTGFGPENVYWPRGTAPSGSYKVQVNYYGGFGTTTYTVLIQEFGFSKTYHGTLTANGQTASVATFTAGSALPLVTSTPPITFDSLALLSRPKRAAQF